MKIVLSAATAIVMSPVAVMVFWLLTMTSPISPEEARSQNAKIVVAIRDEVPDSDVVVARPFSCVSEPDTWGKSTDGRVYVTVVLPPEGMEAEEFSEAVDRALEGLEMGRVRNVSDDGFSWYPQEQIDNDLDEVDVIALPSVHEDADDEIAERISRPGPGVLVFSGCSR